MIVCQQMGMDRKKEIGLWKGQKGNGTGLKPIKDSLIESEKSLSRCYIRRSNQMNNLI